MWFLSTLSALRVVAARSQWGREQVLSHQREYLRHLLSAVWQGSPFYRDYYSAHGIRAGQLGDVTVRDLPIVNKEILMENFDRISKDPVLKRAPIDAWIHSEAPPGLYENRYVVMHTSGSSGTKGIFVYDRSAWSRFKGVSGVRGEAKFRLNPFDRNRLAYYGAIHGRFAGVTGMITEPSLVVKLQLCSVLDPLKKNIDLLNGFQPEKLYGYPSALHELAARALAGELKIQPDYIVCGGEILTPEAAAAIEAAWSVKPTNNYAASESMCIAMKRRFGPGMSLMEDEHIVEMLDDANEPVAPGESGRVVLTALYNRAMPILRYDMRDYVTRGHREPGEPFEPILGVDGRVDDALPIRNGSGADDSVHPLALHAFLIPGVEKFQFVSHSACHVEIRYVADEDKDDEVRDAFRCILDRKGVDPTFKISPSRKEALPPDARTGKFPLVVLAEPPVLRRR